MTRYFRDRAIRSILFVPAAFSAILVIGMVITLFVKSVPILSTKPLTDLLFSSSWQPVAGNFGYFPFIMGTIWVTALAMVIAIPVSLLSAMYLSEYASGPIRGILQPVVDLLAGIPSVIFGLFGILIIVPLIKYFIAPLFGITSSGYCVLAGGLVLAIMVFPILISLSFEVFQTVPREMREAALGLGATSWETTKHVVLKKAFPGVIAVIILGFSRAFGETMAVLMVVGNVARVPTSVFDPAYPLTALIANNYGEMMSIPLYDSALMFAALLLLAIVLVFNLMAKYVLVTLRKAE
ncbi:MAG: phosphate ABC transporter permease subunit PstC [Methanoregula sp.]